VFLDAWYEGIDQGPMFPLVNGNFTYFGGQTTPVDPNHPGTVVNPNAPAFLADGFEGVACIAGFRLSLQGVPNGVGFQVGAETANTNVLALCGSASSPNFFNRASSGGNVGMVLGKANDGSGSTQLANAGTTTNAFILKCLAQMRSMQWSLTTYTPPAGATDFALVRVLSVQVAVGLTVQNT